MIQLRSYLGAYLKQPENVCILPDVFFEGITSVETGELKYTKKGDSDGTAWVPQKTSPNSTHFNEMGGNDEVVKVTFGGKDITGDVSPVMFRGTELDPAKNNKVVYQNAGHLGALDAIDGAAVIKGGYMMKPMIRGIKLK